MKPQDLIDHFGGADGGVTAAAAALLIRPPSVYGWLEKGEIPIDRQCQIEIITGGKLKADRDEDGRPVKPDSRQIVSAEGRA